MEHQQAARSTADDYRDEDDLDTVPLTPPAAAVTTEFFPVSPERVAGTTADGLAPAGPQRQGPSEPGSVRGAGESPAAGPVDRRRNSTSRAEATGENAAASGQQPGAAIAGALLTASAEGATVVTAPTATGPTVTSPAVAGQAVTGPAGFAGPEAPRTRRQSEGAPAPIIPDCCNLGVALRTIIVSNVTALVLAAAQAGDWVVFGQSVLSMAMVLEPALFASLIGLCGVRRWVNGQPLQLQWFMGIALPVVVTGALAWGLARFALPAEPARWAGWTLSRMLLAAAIAAMLLEYFRLRARAYAPSFSEARLQALQARIRPHFLFNSLNTVLGLIRTDPRRAEHTLENLADLFRVFMRDARELVPLDDEVLTCKEYLAIEQLRLTNRPQGRLGHRRDARRRTDPVAAAAAAARERRSSRDRAADRAGHPQHPHHSPRRPGPGGYRQPGFTHASDALGNQMALSNVKERLMLLYDMEADLKTFVHEERFHLQLEFPYRKERRRRDVRRHHIHPDR